MYGSLFSRFIKQQRSAAARRLFDDRGHGLC